MTPIAIPVRNPAGPVLMKRGNRLHLLAAALIGANAYAYMQGPAASPVYFWCQVVIAVDIVLLVMADAETLRESPSYGMFFRIAEVLLFTMAFVQFLMQRAWFPGVLQGMVAAFYGWTFYQEWLAGKDKRILVQHLGVSLPGENGDHFLPWNRIRDLHMEDGSIRLEDTSGNTWNVDLSDIPDEEDLSKMENFKRHYLG